MKLRGWLFAAFFLATTTGVAAQTAPGTTIILPGTLVAGAPATLAVLDAGGRLVAGVEVEFGGGERRSTDATGRLIFTAPDTPGVLSVSLPGQSTGASALVIVPPAQTPAGLRILEIQRLIALRDRFTIRGAGFRGVADENRVTLGSELAAVLAASPVCLVALPGKNAVPGPVQLQVEAGGTTTSTSPVTLVALEMSAEKPHLAPGEAGQLVVRVVGTDQPVELEARDLSPEIVEFPAGSPQRRATQGGTQNNAIFEIRGKSAGDYSIDVRLVPQAQGLPDVAAARQQLLLAQAMVPARFAAHLERLIQDLERHPQDAVQVRDALEKMLAQKPEGEFGRRIEAAWKILLNRE